MPLLEVNKTGLVTAVAAQILIDIPCAGTTVKGHLILVNTHALNIIQYQILESDDPAKSATSWTQHTAYTDINPYVADPANAKKITFNPTSRWTRINVKTKTGTSHGIANGWFKGCGL